MFTKKQWRDLEPELDADVRDLVWILNQLPGIKTVESCSGHGREPISIFFQVEEGDHAGLFLLTRCVDRRYFQYGSQWSIKLSVTDLYPPLPIDFVLTGPTGRSAVKTQTRALIENIREHCEFTVFLEYYELPRIRLEKKP